MNKTPQTRTQSKSRIYVLQRPSALVAQPAQPAPVLPPRQPLPRAVIDPTKPLLKLGLDVHLDFLMAVAQKDHANPQAPRKFTNEQPAAQ